MKQAAKTLQCHVENSLTSCVLPITKGMDEGINNEIISLKRKGGGYRNSENFKTAYFH